jgi:hypothetical protein
MLGLETMRWRLALGALGTVVLWGLLAPRSLWLVCGLLWAFGWLGSIQYSGEGPPRRPRLQR